VNKPSLKQLKYKRRAITERLENKKQNQTKYSLTHTLQDFTFHQLIFSIIETPLQILKVNKGAKTPKRHVLLFLSLPDGITVQASPNIRKNEGYFNSPIGF